MTTKAGFDLGIGLYGLLGGPVGVGVGLGWWGLDLMGAFEGPVPVAVYPPMPNIYSKPGGI
jgi:hypothetical protein